MVEQLGTNNQGDSLAWIFRGQYRKTQKGPYHPFKVMARAYGKGLCQLTLHDSDGRNFGNLMLGIDGVVAYLRTVRPNLTDEQLDQIEAIVREEALHDPIQRNH